ncbi:MAG: adenosylcobinamide-GDP ribazoletransferase [Pseudomonadota bacterium]
MSKTRLLLWDPILAAVLLTRLPMPRLPDAAIEFQARAVWSYPLVGLLVGGLAACVGLLSANLGEGISAGLTLAVLVLITGAMHEDGLADAADGLWGGHDQARRLQIMKDSRIGAYGVLALVVVIGLRWQGLALAGTSEILLAACGSRSIMGLVMAAVPPARTDGLSQGVGRPPWLSAMVALMVAVVLALTLTGPLGLLALAIGLAAAFCIAAIAKRKIGGQTGDILGAIQILAEVTILLVLVA